MALTHNIKHGRINVVTGVTDHTYYTEAEWEGVLVAKNVSALENARRAKSRELQANAQAAVDAIVHPTQIQEMQLRAMELLEAKFDGGLDPAEEDELTTIKALRAETKAIRKTAAAALIAVAAAKDAATIESITL